MGFMEKTLESFIVGGLFGGLTMLILKSGAFEAVGLSVDASMGLVVGGLITASLHMVKRTVGPHTFGLLLRAPTAWIPRMFKAVFRFVKSTLVRLFTFLRNLASGKYIRDSAEFFTTL